MISPMDEVRKCGERREAHMKNADVGPASSWKVKSKAKFIPFGNSQYPENAYQMLQFYRIPIVVVQNDFLR